MDVCASVPKAGTTTGVIGALEVEEETNESKGVVSVAGEVAAVGVGSGAPAGFKLASHASHARFSGGLRCEQFGHLTSLPLGAKA